MMEDSINYDKPNTAGCGMMSIGFLLLIALILFVDYRRQSSLKNDGQLVTAKVVDYTLGKNNSLEVVFDYKKEVYRKYTWTSVETYKWSRLVGHSFPALYTEDEDVIMLLVFPEDFKKYNIKPDSIPVWVRDNLMY